MLTPSKEHLAEGLIWKIGKRPMLQSDINAGNFDGIPNELRPLDKILWTFSPVKFLPDTSKRGFLSWRTEDGSLVILD